MEAQLTPPKTVHAIQRMAKKLKQEAGMPHVQALEVVSKQLGYHNYNHAKHMLGESRPQTYDVYITDFWRDREKGTSGRETYRHTISKPLVGLLTPYQMKASRDLAGYKLVAPDHLVQQHNGHSQAYSRGQTLKAVRALDFIVATGLKPSNADTRAYYKGDRNKMFPTLDHSHVWYDAKNNQYIVIDEPYGPFPRLDEERNQWAERTGWQVARSAWDGMYWPGGHTVMYLSTSGKNGYSLKPLLDILSRMPAPPEDTPWTGQSGTYSARFETPLTISSQN